MERKKILFVYLNTGGGHLAPSKAISDYLKLNYSGDVETVMVNPFIRTNKLVRFIIEDGYRILQNNAKWIYEAIYAVYKINFISRISSKIVANSVRDYLTETFIKEKPDQVVITHFFCIRPVYEIRESLGLKFTVNTIVTDPYTAHPLWFLRKEQNFLLFSDTLRNKCIKNGISEQNITVLPFILNDKFSRPASDEEKSNYRIKHGFGSGRIVLILGGGDGIPKGRKILRNLAGLNADCEFAIVCGKNKLLFDEATAMKENGSFTNLKVFGYVNFVYELLSISDIVISKCGASTFFEILILKKLAIVSSYLWEQEKGNVDFLVDNGLGIYESRIRRLSGLISRLLNDEKFFSKYKTNIEIFEAENGTQKVSEFLLNFK